MLRTDWVDGNDVTADVMNDIGLEVNALSGYATKTSAYTLGATDRVIFANAQGASFTLTLPDAVTNGGKQYTIKKVDNTVNTVAIATTSSQTIDGMPSALLVFGGHRVTVMSDGANWNTIESNYLGTQLGYAEIDISVSTTNSTLSALNLNKIVGLSITTVGIGRPVRVTFSSRASNTVANAFNGAQLLMNNSPAGGGGGSSSSPSPLTYESLAFEATPPLTLGTVYTFEVGIWCAPSSQAVYYADTTTPYPTYLSVVGA